MKVLGLVAISLGFAIANAEKYSYENVPQVYVTDKTSESCVAACTNKAEELKRSGFTILSKSLCSDEYLSQNDRDQGYTAGCKISFLK